MQIEYKPISELRAYAQNSRTHSDAQVAKLARSLDEFGMAGAVVIRDGVIAKGHGTTAAARTLYEAGERLYPPPGRTGGAEPFPDGTVPVIDATGWTDAQFRAFVIADNQLALDAGWDLDVLRDEVGALLDAEFDADAVAALMNDERATLLHADPPYGMGKQKDGVENDNLYKTKLDDFQMEWWRAWRTYVVDNGSAYIWGNALDLWRLWFAGGLGASERLELRNEIVWDKQSVPGMKSEAATSYPIASERCLFFQFGDQFLGNVNSDDYWEGWEPIRRPLEAGAKAAGLTPRRCREITGVQMYAHWFSKSQWAIISRDAYTKLQTAFPGCWLLPYDELRRQYDELRPAYRDHLRGARVFFDNTHDIMRDTWTFPRVHGDERHGHATPKPAAMMERACRTSCPEGGLVVEPFGGSGSTLIGAEMSRRRCYTMELTPAYCDVIVKRWQNLTGLTATNAATGEVFPG